MSRTRTRKRYSGQHQNDDKALNDVKSVFDSIVTALGRDQFLVSNQSSAPFLGDISLRIQQWSNQQRKYFGELFFSKNEDGDNILLVALKRLKSAEDRLLYHFFDEFRRWNKVDGRAYCLSVGKQLDFVMMRDRVGQSPTQIAVKKRNTLALGELFDIVVFYLRTDVNPTQAQLRRVDAMFTELFRYFQVIDNHSEQFKKECDAILQEAIDAIRRVSEHNANLSRLQQFRRQINSVNCTHSVATQSDQKQAHREETSLLQAGPKVVTSAEIIQSLLQQLQNKDHEIENLKALLENQRISESLSKGQHAQAQKEEQERHEAHLKKIAFLRAQLRAADDRIKMLEGGLKQSDEKSKVVLYRKEWEKALHEHNLLPFLNDICQDKEKFEICTSFLKEPGSCGLGILHYLFDYYPLDEIPELMRYFSELTTLGNPHFTVSDWQNILANRLETENRHESILTHAVKGGFFEKVLPVLTASIMQQENENLVNQIDSMISDNAVNMSIRERCWSILKRQERCQRLPNSLQEVCGRYSFSTQHYSPQGQTFYATSSAQQNQHPLQPVSTLRVV